MKYYLIAGEASGDLHAANVMKSLRKEDKNAMFRFWGGDKMKSVGGELVTHYNETAFMGFVEVLKHLKTILGFIQLCVKDIVKYQPDVVIFVDYPGFNMRVAKKCRRLIAQGILSSKLVYYIAPQAWAWKQNRVHALMRDCDKVLTILPFEKAFFKRFNYDVDYVGHPLLDALDDFTIDSEFKQQLNIPANRKVIALLPGSRTQEVNKHLETMVAVAAQFPDYHFIIAAVPHLASSGVYHKWEQNNLSYVVNKTYDLLTIASAAVVCSGTATLETALFNVPQVVGYKGSKLSYWIGKQLVKVNYISLVNLIMDECIVTELIQHEFTSAKVTASLHKILNHDQADQMRNAYKLLSAKLGGKGASDNVANKVISEVLKS